MILNEPSGTSEEPMKNHFRHSPGLGENFTIAVRSLRTGLFGISPLFI